MSRSQQQNAGHYPNQNQERQYAHNQQSGNTGHSHQPSSGRPQGSNEERSFMNIKSHGAKNAIEVAPDNTTKNWQTIRLEGAPKMQDGSKAYDWSNKISIQLTKSELPVVIGVLLGYLPSCTFKNHGGDANKWFSIENQGTKFYFKIGQASTSKMMPCPVPTVEAHLMGLLALAQHAKNFEGLSTDAALEAIKVMCGHMVRNNSFPQPQNKAR